MKQNMNAILIETVMALAFAGIVATQKVADSKRNAEAEKAKVVFLQNNMPYLKDSRDQISYQMSVCDANVKKLQEMLLVYKETDSKEILNQKMSEIRRERENLGQLYSRLNTELERSMLHKEFNNLDAGGLRQAEVADLVKEAEKAVGQAQRVNLYIKQF